MEQLLEISNMDYFYTEYPIWVCGYIAGILYNKWVKNRTTFSLHVNLFFIEKLEWMVPLGDLGFWIDRKI